jgi:hypothetical protein
MNLRAVALVSGVAGGLCWSTRLVLHLTEAGGTGLLDALHWAGLVLLAVAMVGFGAGLVSSSAGWLRVIVGVAFPALVWSVLEVFRPVADTEVVDGVFGVLVLVVSLVGLSRRPTRPEPPPRRTHRGAHRGAHAR